MSSSAASSSAAASPPSLADRLCATIRTELLEWADARRAQGAALAPPPESTERACKGLRNLLQLGRSAEATPEQARLADRTIDDLLAQNAQHACTVCAAVSEATAAIGAIEADEDVDTAEAGLMRWGHLRVNLCAACAPPVS